MASSLASSLLVISLLIGVCYSFEDGAMKCVHDPNKVKLIRGVLLNHDDVQPRRKRQVTSTPFRVSFVHHSSGVATPQQVARIQRIIQDVQGTLRSMLNVKFPLTRPLLLQRTCTMGDTPVYNNYVRIGCRHDCEVTSTCGPIPLPEDHLEACIACNSSTNLEDCRMKANSGAGPGLNNTDTVVYYAILNNADCARAAAYANSCQLEAMFDRPISGYIVFCLQALTRLSDTVLYSAAIHEVTHVLGFSSALYQFYRDEDGNPRTQRLFGFPLGSTDTTFRTVQYSDWLTRHGRVSHSVTMMVTPNVIRQASLQFGCAIDSITGVELENNRGEATAGSHWESRVLGNEYMTGEVTFNHPVSRITLGLLHDTGWYVPNYERAGALAWGKGAGCRFLHGSCLEHITNQISRRVTLNPFCNVLRGVPGSYKTCTVDRDLAATCNLALLGSTLSTKLQYFTSGANFNASTVDLSRVGGSVEVFDRCPFHQPSSNSRSCSNNGNQPSSSNNIRGETYSTGSRCFEHGRGWNRIDSNGQRMSVDRGVGCYQYACNSNGVEIKLFNQGFLCACEGEELVIDIMVNNYHYQGSFICPSCNDICFDSLANCTNSSNRAPPCPGQVTITHTTTAISIPPSAATRPRPLSSEIWPSLWPTISPTPSTAMPATRPRPLSSEIWPSLWPTISSTPSTATRPRSLSSEIWPSLWPTISPTPSTTMLATRPRSLSSETWPSPWPTISPTPLTAMPSSAATQSHPKPLALVTENQAESFCNLTPHFYIFLTISSFFHFYIIQ